MVTWDLPVEMGRPLEARGVGVVPDMRIFVGLTGTETELTGTELKGLRGRGSALFPSRNVGQTMTKYFLERKHLSLPPVQNNCDNDKATRVSE